MKKLHVNPKAKPVAVTKPANIPLNWMDEIKAELDKDERLGVIQRVPVNTPVEWCCRMGVIPKKDGSPRRVIDLRPVNQATIKQTHALESPFIQA